MEETVSELESARNPSQVTLENIILNRGDVQKAISSLPNKYSSGPDGLKIEWIKKNKEKFYENFNSLIQ